MLEIHLEGFWPVAIALFYWAVGGFTVLRWLIHQLTAPEKRRIDISQADNKRARLAWAMVPKDRGERYQ